MFSLIYVWKNGWVHSREAGDLRRHRAHYDVIVMANDIIKNLSPAISVYDVDTHDIRMTYLKEKYIR